MTIASDHYTGDEGEGYYRATAASKTPVAQREQARVFEPYVMAHHVVLDFGCGTGGILGALPAARRIGIEINEPSAAEARGRGVEVYGSTADVPDAVADRVITHHALEHVADPFAVLTDLRRILKPGGVIVVVVPAEEPRRRGNAHYLGANDDSRHLFNWTPRTLGNLMAAAGFCVTATGLSAHTGYSRYVEWLRPFGLLGAGEWAVARLASRWSSVVVARK